MAKSILRSVPGRFCSLLPKLKEIRTVYAAGFPGCRDDWDLAIWVMGESCDMSYALQVVCGTTVMKTGSGLRICGLGVGLCCRTKAWVEILERLRAQVFGVWGSLGVHKT